MLGGTWDAGSRWVGASDKVLVEKVAEQLPQVDLVCAARQLSCMAHPAAARGRVLTAEAVASGCVREGGNDKMRK